MPVLRRMLARMMALVLAFSFVPALAMPGPAMGLHCADAADSAAAHATMAHEGTASPALHRASGHPSGHLAAHHAPPEASGEMAKVASADGTGTAPTGHPGCCLAACPACLPAVATGPGLAAPAAARRSHLTLSTRLPDGLPPGEALDPPRSLLA